MKDLNRDEILKKEMALAEAIYGTEHDPDQMPINEDSVRRLDALYKNWLETEFDERGEPISWVVVLPTQKELAEKFLNKEITEKDLLYMTQPQDFYDSLYLVSVITVPEKRRMGFAEKVLVRSIAHAPIHENSLLFAWPISTEGNLLIKKVSEKIGKNITIRS